MPSARDGSARGVSEGGARLLGIRYADRADVLPIAEYGAPIVASSTPGSVWLCAHDSGVIDALLVAVMTRSQVRTRERAVFARELRAVMRRVPSAYRQL